MNSKFFDVKKEKQDNIINAALRIFAVKGYKDASTDVIVKEAGISKGLLFHYFISKQGLYEFICDYSTKYMTLELTRSVKDIEKDFFIVMSQIEMARTRVARNYPYMQQFLRSIRYEKDEEAIRAIGKSIDDLDITYNNIYGQISTKKFINPDDAQTVYKIIGWINDGFIKDELNNSNKTPDELNEEFATYLELLRRYFYKSDENSSLSIAKEELVGRDDSIMDEIQMEKTFEERLEAGRRPLVDLPPEEIKDTTEDVKTEANSEESKSNDNAQEDSNIENEVSEEVESTKDAEEDDFLDEEDAETPDADKPEEDETIDSDNTVVAGNVNIPVYGSYSSITNNSVNRSSESIDAIIAEAESNLEKNN